MRAVQLLALHLGHKTKYLPTQQPTLLRTTDAVVNRHTLCNFGFVVRLTNRIVRRVACTNYLKTVILGRGTWLV